jgi:hypothetical protein
MSGETTWLSGKPYELPVGSEFIVVRVPAHVEVSSLDKIKINTLKEDPKEITSQLSFLSTVGDGSSFAQFRPTRSFSYVSLSSDLVQDKGTPVEQEDKKAHVPPKGVMSSVPFVCPPKKQKRVVVKAPASLKESPKKKKHRKSQA